MLVASGGPLTLNRTAPHRQPPSIRSIRRILRALMYVRRVSFKRQSQGKHAVIGLDVAVGIGFRGHLAEAEPLQQADGARISRVDGRENRTNPEVAGKVWKSRATGFECNSAAPVLGCENKCKICGGPGINGCLNVTGTLP